MAQFKIQNTHSSIISQWADQTSFGIFGSRRRIEIHQNAKGELDQIRVISQSFLNRMLSWLSVQSEDTGWKVEVLNAKPVTAEIWKLAAANLYKDDFQEIIGQQIDAIVKKPGIDHGMHQLGKALLIRTEAEFFKTTLDNFEPSIVSKWNSFLQKKFAEKTDNLSELENEINHAKQCVLNLSNDIDAIDARIGEGDADKNIAPLKVRYFKLLNPLPFSANTKLQKVHGQLWTDLQEKIKSPKSIEDLEKQHAAFHQAESAENILFSILRSHSKNGFGACYYSAKNKVVDILNAISPKLDLPKTISMRQIKDRHQRLTLDAANNELNAQQLLKLEELNAALQALNMLQSIADEEKLRLQKIEKEFKPDNFDKTLQRDWEEFFQRKYSIDELFKDSVPSEIREKQKEIIEKCQTERRGFGKYLEHFDHRISRGWDSFLKESSGQESPESWARIRAKQNEIIAQCRSESHKEAELALAQLRSNYDRVESRANSKDHCNALVALRERSWSELIARIRQASSIKEIDGAYESILDEQIADESLLEILQESLNHGFESCLKLARAKAIVPLQKLAPELQSPEAITAELIEERAAFFASQEKSLSEKDIETLRDLSAYASALRILKGAMDENVNIEVAKKMQLLTPSLNVHQSKSIEALLHGFEKEKQMGIGAPQPAAFEIIDEAIAQYAAHPKQKFFGMSYHSLPIACMAHSAEKLGQNIASGQEKPLAVGLISLNDARGLKAISNDKELFDNQIACLETCVHAATENIDFRIKEMRKQTALLKPRAFAQLFNIIFYEHQLPPADSLQKLPLKNLFKTIARRERMLDMLENNLIAIQKAQPLLPVSSPASQDDAYIILEFLEKIPGTQFLHNRCLSKVKEALYEKIHRLTDYWRKLVEQLNLLTISSPDEQQKLQEISALAKQHLNAIDKPYKQLQKLTTCQALTDFDKLLNQLEKREIPLQKALFLEDIPGSLPAIHLISQQTLKSNIEKIDRIVKFMSKLDDSMPFQDETADIASLFRQAIGIHQEYARAQEDSQLIPIKTLESHAKELAGILNKLETAISDK